MVTTEKLERLGLKPVAIDTYQKFMSAKPALSRDEAGVASLAKELGVVPKTVLMRVARVEHALKVGRTQGLTGTSKFRQGLEHSNPEKFAKAVVGLSAPAANAAQVALDCGIARGTAVRIGEILDEQCPSLKRVVSDVRLEDLIQKFGTLTSDALDAITTDKLSATGAKDLAIIAGIGAEKWQLFRGQPTSRMEINDRREMNELVKLVLQEAKRRNIEIDVTPEGSVTATKSPYKNAHHQRAMKQIESGDPAGTLT